MKKTFYLLFLTLFTTFSLTNEAYSQDDKLSKREQRKQERLLNEEEQIKTIKELIETKDFTFHATVLTSSGYAGISNIRLTGLWFISVKDTQLKCYLPVYGTATPISLPSIMSRLDIFTEDFTYDIKAPNGKQKNYVITIVTKDTRSSSTYTIELYVPLDGNGVLTRISSSFNAPVTFSGYLEKM
ncbi:MAG: DUF4251 domain-containing protein [Rikenellaceae bacterium]